MDTLDDRQSASAESNQSVGSHPRGQITFRAGPGSPCAACRSETKGCSTTDNGLHMCRGDVGPEWMCVARDRGGFNCYRRKDERGNPRGHSSSPPKANRQRDWVAQATTFAAALTDDHKAELAALLQLPPTAIAAIDRLGFSPASGFWTFPEWDGAGGMVGINRRYRDNQQKAMQGSKRGLTIPVGWKDLADEDGVVLVVEGASDVVALTMCGLAAVGRPSNTGGAEYLAELFSGLSDCNIIVLGENDQKTNGDWPGKVGAERIAGQLAKQLKRDVLIALPPATYKDARAWVCDVRAGWGDAEDWSGLRQAIRDHLAANSVRVAAAEPAAAATAGDAGLNEAPNDPHRLARVILASRRACGLQTLHYWHGDFLEWDGCRYKHVPRHEFVATVNRLIRVELEALHRAAMRDHDPSDEDDLPEMWKVTRRLASDVIAALEGLCILPGVVESPSWINGANSPDPFHLVATPGGLVDLPLYAASKPNAIIPTTPAFFNFNAIRFQPDPLAPKPQRWWQFLNELWPDNAGPIELLQEWLGYLLVPDTRYQKILLLQGAKRGGKGTIQRIIKQLVGPVNCCSPTLADFGYRFGLAPLLDTSVAMIGDTRLEIKPPAALVERLLAISGEDSISIDRKFLPPVTTKLRTRIVISTNAIPQLRDNSGALASRFCILPFYKSFQGKEDTYLLEKLLLELPGIFNFAVHGYMRLSMRGRFCEPEASKRAAQVLAEVCSPLGTFLEECCEVGLQYEARCQDLFDAFQRWCKIRGHKLTWDISIFGAELHGCVPSIEKFRPRVGGKRVWTYKGVGPKRPSPTAE